MNGKGDKRRPEDRAKIDANWDRIFKSGSEMAYEPKITCIDMLKPADDEPIDKKDDNK
jgi:hypothetical protein